MSRMYGNLNGGLEPHSSLGKSFTDRSEITRGD